MPAGKNRHINREISWLSFNGRVLQEADDATVPLLERLRFLAIFSSNLDEFFRVRVATLKRMMALGKKAKKTIGIIPKKTVTEIYSIVIGQQNKFNSIYEELLLELEKENILIVNEKELTPEQGVFVRTYFHREVRPVLVPLMIDEITDFPYLKDHAIYLAVLLSDSKENHKPKYAVIEIPTDAISRFLVLPSVDDKNYVILLDDIIRYCLDDVFYIFPHNTFHAWTVKMTRDAELDLLDDISESLMEKMEKSLKQRKRGAPVRFIYDIGINPALLDYMLKRMHLKKGDNNLVAGARYHNFKDFMNFPSLGKSHLLYPKKNAVFHPSFLPNTSILQAIAQNDLLLHFPYHSFDHVIDLLREAAIDPKVTEIKITLYRLAKNSKVANSLINAVRNGKKVMVMMELLARFDEEHNIMWADRLREEGAKVLFSNPGLKVHSKVCLITRKEKGREVQYAYVATGNFNETTAKLYTDIALLTADKRITNELEELFQFFQNPYHTLEYKNLLVAPFNMRKKLERLFEMAMNLAKNNRPAKIDIKLNNLADNAMIEKILEAAKVGVKIRLMVRSSCTIGRISEKLQQNIEMVSIVDRYLEHSRIFVFYLQEDLPLVFISSADWMLRNLDHRVEMICPVFDPVLSQQLIDVMNIHFTDNTKARYIDVDRMNEYKQNDEAPFRSQIAFYDYYAELFSKRNGATVTTAAVNTVVAHSE